MLTTPRAHDECLAIDGIMCRRNCRPSRSHWRHQSVLRAAFPGSKSHLVGAQVLQYPHPLIWRKPRLIRPRRPIKDGTLVLYWYHVYMGHLDYFNKRFCQEELVKTTVIREIWQWLGVESVRGRYSGGKSFRVSCTPWDAVGLSERSPRKGDS
jgi:hypothetical protein